VIVLTVYSRPGCHLCDDLIAELTGLVDGRARIEVVDISEDEALHERYFLEIPVVKHGDEELSRFHLDSARVTDLLERLGH
jgi:hypothetical protein